jgi:hypothetical protein
MKDNDPKIDSKGKRTDLKDFTYGDKEDKDYKEFDAIYRPYAEAAVTKKTEEKRYVPVDILLAQAYIESSGGRHPLNNNLSGLKASKSEKNYGLYETTEFHKDEDYYKKFEKDSKFYVDTIKFPPRKPGEYREVVSTEYIDDENNPNYGSYRYRVQDYFSHSENVQEGFEKVIDNFYISPFYSKAVSDKKVVIDPDLFLKSISGNYATEGGYYGIVNPYLQKSKAESKRIQDEKIEKLKEEERIKQERIDSINELYPSMINPYKSKLVNPQKLKEIYKFKNGGKNMKGNIEAEGKELILRNSNGDMAIIPKQYRLEALDMLKEGCHGCLDNLISTLPKASNYAEDGTVFGIPPNTSTAPSSTIQSVNQNVNTSLIGKTREDIPQYNPGQTFIGPDNRTDYERQRDHEAMTAYLNPTILEQFYSGARMVTRAVADPIQGVGQVFDLVGLGDTRIGQDLGNFNDEEAQYRYRNLNPNINAGQKFMGNLNEGSEIAAWGATNFIPFENSVINPIVKGLVGKGNYSSYLANPLYSSVVNQGVKEVVEGSVVKQVDDVIQPAKSSFQVKELPGLHLQSTMENGAISKIVDKTGKINTEQAFGIIAKESGGAEKLAIIKKGFGDNIPSKMDFNEFRKITQEQLIPLEKQFSTYRSNYGIERIGYQDITLNKNAMIDVENQIKYLIENEGIDSPNLKRWNDRLNELKSNVTPLENQTLILGNKSKFGRGSSAHGNPEETLGHIHFLRDAETPDVLTVTQIQSDAFQGTNRTMPKTFNKEKELINLAKMEYIVKQQKVELSKAIKRSDGYWELSDGTLISDDVYKQGWTMQEEFNAIKKAEIENFTQKQLLDKNHQERYIQEFVDYAGKRGDINKIRVPTSETAAKVQGYSKNVNPKEILEMLEEFKKDGIYEKKMSELNNEDKKMVEKIINKEITENTYYTEHQTILKKYSEQPKTIKKLFGEEPKIVTDSKGNTWYEFDIPKKFKEGKGEIKAFTTIPVGIGTVGAIGASQDK